MTPHARPLSIRDGLLVWWVSFEVTVLGGGMFLLWMRG